VENFVLGNIMLLIIQMATIVFAVSLSCFLFIMTLGRMHGGMKEAKKIRNSEEV
jgi:hypothetical protein